MARIDRLRRLAVAAAIVPCITFSLAAHDSVTAQDAGPAPDVAIQVDLDQRVGDMTPIWAYFGYDESTFTYLPDGRNLLSELSELSPVPVYVRTHNMLTSHEGPPVALKWGSTNAYTEDENGNPVYDWTDVDRIVDVWFERGIKPLMEIGFMPKALSSNPEPYRHNWSPGDPYADIWTGWAHPPEDYEKWAELIYQWVRHSVERYGADEVSTWWWQVWNEPDAGYWAGTDEEFFKLHDYTADAVKRALPAARIGGPHVTGAYSRRQGAFLRAFLEHCRSGTNYVTGETGSPLDFIAFHAKGSPQVTDQGHVRMRMSFQLRQIAAAFEIVRSFPEFGDLPVIIGESDPEGCAACSSVVYPHNSYRNGTMFSSYVASSFAKKYELADEIGTNLVGAVSWTFIFPDHPYFAGFRSLAAASVIGKPVLNVFRMFGMMGGDRVAVRRDNAYTARRVIAEGVLAEPDINALASRDGNVASIMIWNYHDDDVKAPPARVRLDLANVPASQAMLHHYRIDETHSNAYTKWLEMGAPQQLSREQLASLRESGHLELLTSPQWVNPQEGALNIALDLPRQGVSLLQLTWEDEPGTVP
ncbi:MAG: GH39 family glycosyl hydrolase [Longimicrobiales bacterium]